MSELDELLSRLPSATETPQTFEGKAVGRDKDHLHLAISSGVIAIPVAEIEKVTFLDGQPNDIVSVHVRHADRIKQIRHVSRMLRNLVLAAAVSAGAAFSRGEAIHIQWVATSTQRRLVVGALTPQMIPLGRGIRRRVDVDGRVVRVQQMHEVWLDSCPALMSRLPMRTFE